MMQDPRGSMCQGDSLRAVLLLTARTCRYIFVMLSSHVASCCMISLNAFIASVGADVGRAVCAGKSETMALVN